MHEKIYHAEYTLFDTGKLIHFVSLKSSYHMHSLEDTVYDALKNKMK